MDASRFDHLTRSLAAASSRRRLLSDFAILGFAAAFVREAASAKKRRKKPQLNAFGCVGVGGKCRGNDDLCCSGICEGKKPKKGKRDTSRCVDHDTSDCAVGHLPCGGPHVDCTSSSGFAGLCYTTTGNAGYCAKGGICFTCSKDADCRPFCGPQAACIICKECESPTVHTACVGISGCTPP